MKIKDIHVKYTKCEDGTCISDEKECNTSFECPIGYITCGVKCNLMKQLLVQMTKFYLVI